MSFSRTLVLTTISIFFSGCFLFGSSSTSVITGDFQTLPAGSHQAILEKIRSAQPDLTALRILARTTLTFGSHEGNFRQVILTELPDKLRVETVPPQSFYTLQLLVASDTKAIVVDTTDRSAYTSEDPRLLVYKSLGVTLRPSQLLALLSGSVDRESTSKPESLSQERSSGTIVLTRNGGRVRYLIDPQSFRPQVVELDDIWQDSLALRATYTWNSADSAVSSAARTSDFREGKQELPSGIVLELIRKGASLTLHYLTAEKNPDIKPTLFDPAAVRIPANYSIRDLQSID